MHARYPQLLGAPGGFYFELLHLCAWLLLRRDGHAEPAAPATAPAAAEAAATNAAPETAVAFAALPSAAVDAATLRRVVEAISEVLDTFENEPETVAFFNGHALFAEVASRSRRSFDDFGPFHLQHLPDLARLGVEVLNRVRGMPLAERALLALYQRYLRSEPPEQWKSLFKEASKMAYNLKYMFRESLPKAKAKFIEHLDHNLSGPPRELFSKLVDGALATYKGLVDQTTLASTDFLTNPRALVDVVLEGVKGEDVRVQLLGEIAAKYMQTYLEQDPPRLPLTPHHTQILAMLLFSHFFEQRERWAREYGQRSLILQMKTGEGKSIVIAMLAIYTVVHLKKRVHILENNEGLLQRDFKTYEPFYKQFGLVCAKTIDSTSDICYCLKRENNAYFNTRLLEGELKLDDVVLIVDEVDDLVVNEKPSLLYKKADALLTPQYSQCYEALHKNLPCPAGVARALWDDCVRIKREADAKVEGVDYARIQRAASEGAEDGAAAEVGAAAEGAGQKEWAMLETGPDGIARLPKVPLTDDWLVYKNFADFGLAPSKDTFRSCLCTPIMYNKYCCIFGLTGSVGGAAERAYIEKTYQAVPYEVPQFLHTCDQTDKAEATNLGVRLEPTTDAMIAQVVAAAKKYYRDVPVLIITRGAENQELLKVTKALNAIADDPSEPMPKPSMWARRAKRTPGIQRLQERNDAGELMIDECEGIVERATKRCYTDTPSANPFAPASARESYFRITVTDWYGGRGHDFDCADERANAAGGMLVICTSVPDAREWTQWKGRTARQDRPGQYLVVLSEQDEPFKHEPALAATLRALPADGAIDELLRRRDVSIREALSGFESQQARGAWLAELCEKYFHSHPRAPTAEWPSIEHRSSDVKLRDLLRLPFASGEKVVEAAASRLGIELNGPPAEWGWQPKDAFGIEPKRKDMAVTFLIDRTYETFLQTVVDAVLRVFDKHLEPDDLVGYYGLGDGWIFEMERKGEPERAAHLRAQIASSVEKRGEPHVYSSIQRCVSHLAEMPDGERYSKWLVVLTDTADFQCTNAKGHFDKDSPQRAEEATKQLMSTMQATSELNLVLIDASEIGNFNQKHHMWPTWRALSRRLTDEVGDGNSALYIDAANEAMIDEAFDKLAGAMQGGAVG